MPCVLWKAVPHIYKTVMLIVHELTSHVVE